MSIVRDDPSVPDEGFAELYAQLPDATDLSPWLELVPSNILDTVERLRHAAAHLTAGGVLAAELTNPHWLQAGGGKGVRVTAFDGNQARLEVDYAVSGGQHYVQKGEVHLVWPDEADRWLASSGLTLRRMFARDEGTLASSPTFFLVASK